MGKGRQGNIEGAAAFAAEGKKDDVAVFDCTTPDWGCVGEKGHWGHCAKPTAGEDPVEAGVVGVVGMFEGVLFVGVEVAMQLTSSSSSATAVVGVTAACCCGNMAGGGHGMNTGIGKNEGPFCI